MSSTKYELHITGEFKLDLKRCKKRGFPLDDLWAIVRKLLNGETLDPKHRVHQLHNDRKGQWECHNQPDWLLHSPDRASMAFLASTQGGRIVFHPPRRRFSTSKLEL